MNESPFPETLTEDVLVDAEFASLCPPLSAEEYATLEASVLEEGCRDALAVWTREPEDLEASGFGLCKGAGCRYENAQVPHGEWVLEGGRWTCPECGFGIAPYNEILLDGHNRKRICDEHGLNFDITWVSLPDRAAARAWIWRNQLGRRNLHPDAAALMRGRLYNAEKRDVGRPVADELGKSCPISTAERLASEMGVSPRTIKNDGQLAAAVDALTPYAPDVSQMVMAGDLARKDVVEAAVWAKTEPERAAHLLISQSKSNEWYTPPEYVEAARSVMGGVDCDPASNDIAQEWIAASEYHTIADDGLLYDWRGRVWLNPPWGSIGSRFVGRLMDQLASGNTTEAVLLVNAHATDTKWFTPLWDGLLCFTDHRINYYPGAPDPGSTDDDTAKGGSTHGSVFVYFGPHRAAFAREFARWGAIVARVNDEH